MCVYCKLGCKPSELNVGLHIDNTLEAFCSTNVRQQKRECLAREQRGGCKFAAPYVFVRIFLRTVQIVKCGQNLCLEGPVPDVLAFFRLLFPLPVWESAILNFGSLPLSTNVCQHRQTSGSVLGVKSKSGVVENVGQPLESRCKQLPFKSYFQFRFGGRHLESVVTNVG